MAQFTLEWDAAALADNDNATGVRALYRYKTVGGSFISTGFTPANDLAKDVETVDSPVLDNNKVVEFEIMTICTENTGTINDNGIQEMIRFACIDPSIVKTHNSSTLTLDLTGTDITKARLTVRKASDNSVVMAATIVNPVAHIVTKVKTGLLESTSYYWQIELYANINSVEVKSSDAGFLGTPCSPYSFTTDAPPTCNPITAGTITSIEIL